MGIILLAPFAIFLEFNLALNLLLVLPAPIVNTLTFLAGQFD